MEILHTTERHLPLTFCTYGDLLSKMSCHGRQNLRHCFTERRQAQHEHLESTSRLTFPNEGLVKHIYLYGGSGKAILVYVTLPDHQICLGTCPQTLQMSGVWPNLVEKLWWCQESTPHSSLQWDLLQLVARCILRTHTARRILLSWVRIGESRTLLCTCMSNP